MAPTASCGPSSAAMPASCTNGGTHEVELTKNRTSGSTSGAGTAAKPQRQPVIAYVFDSPSSTSVRSSSEPKRVMLENGSSYCSCE